MTKFLGVPVRPGEIVRERVPIAEFADGSPVSLPVVTIGGRHEGPTLYVQAGVHGEELTGVEVCRRALETFDPEVMHGNLVSVPVANVPAYLTRTRGYRDEERWMIDIYRNFPGDPAGILTQRLAHVLFENFVRESDYTIDMHSALDGGTIAPFTYVLPDDDKNGTLEIREKCAWAYGSPYIYYHTRGVKFGTTVATTSLPLEADNVSAPLMLAEMGESRRVSPEYIDLGVRGIQNVAKAMGILKGEPDIRVPQRKFHHFAIAHSDHGGGLKMVVEPQDEVTVGQPLAEVYDIFGDRVEVVESPADGFVLRVLKFGTISTGGEVAWIGH